MRKKNREIEEIPSHILELIRVTPEMTQECLSKLKYTIKPRPEGKKPRGKYYCPYCGVYSEFRNRRDEDGSYPRSKCCGISLEDYWVKYWNGLF